MNSGRKISFFSKKINLNFLNFSPHFSNSTQPILYRIGFIFNKVTLYRIAR